MLAQTRRQKLEKAVKKKKDIVESRSLYPEFISPTIPSTRKEREKQKKKKKKN